MRLIKLPIPRINVVKRPSLRPHMSTTSGSKRKSASKTITVDVDNARPVSMPAARKSTVAEKLAYAMAGSMLLGLGVLATTAQASYAALDTAITTSAQVIPPGCVSAYRGDPGEDPTVVRCDSPEVTSSDINDYTPETTTEAAPSAECDAYVPAKYRVCPQELHSTRYPLKAKSKAKSSRSTSAPTKTTTTSVRKSTSATGAKSTTTTKSVKVSK